MGVAAGPRGRPGGRKGINMNEHAKPRAEPCECTNCGWHGAYSERVWAHYAGSGLSFRGYLCPVCYLPSAQIVQGRQLAAADRAELAHDWPGHEHLQGLPDGIDRFAEYPVSGEEQIR